MNTCHVSYIYSTFIFQILTSVQVNQYEDGNGFRPFADAPDDLVTEVAIKKFQATEMTIKKSSLQRWQTILLARLMEKNVFKVKEMTIKIFKATIVTINMLQFTNKVQQ